jgi:hypothetical protein
VTISSKTAVLVTVALLAAVTLAGCAPGAPARAGSGTPFGSSPTTATATTATTTPGPAAPAAGAKPGLTESDAASIDHELDAMQKELDGLNMPSDSDYSGAAGAVY